MTISRIWDLRRGDADDNRTSPYGAGWGRLVFSSALEFSYLKAILGFLILLVIPALLVGIAPSIVITYGRHMFESLASAGRNPTVFALLLLAFLIALAALIGRRFLYLALDNYAHLHYTLVFPVFVAIREVFRSIAERLPGMSNTQEHLYRRRRIGTVLAALLLGGAGFALAMSVELSAGLQLVDVERVRPWAVLKAALGNAALVLGFSTAAVSLFWLWRELTVSAPVLDWTPSPQKAAAPVVRVAHLSDLHVVGERYGYRMETGTHGPQGNRCVREALQRLAAVHAANPIDRVVITGDVTDAGVRAEWAEFIDVLRQFPELRSRMSLVPGNHDTNIVDRTNTGRPDLPWSVGQALRKLRFVLALDEVEGERAHLVDGKSGALGPSLAEYLREGNRAEPTARIGRAGKYARPVGDGREGLGDDLSAGRARDEGRRVWGHTSGFECTQQFLAHERNRICKPEAVARSKGVVAKQLGPRVVNPVAPSSCGVPSAGNPPERPDRPRADERGRCSVDNHTSCFAHDRLSWPSTRRLDRQGRPNGTVLCAVGDHGGRNGPTLYRPRIHAWCERKHSADGKRARGDLATTGKRRLPLSEGILNN